MQLRIWRILLILLLMPAFALANGNSTDLTWGVPESQYNLTLTLDFNRHPDVGDTKLLRVTVAALDGSVVTGATVDANMTLPGDDVNYLSFVGSGDGNYDFNYTYTLDGTHIWDVNATKDGNNGIASDYIYAGSYSMTMTFTGDSSFSAGAAASVVASVTDENNVTIVGGDGNITIYYPDGTVFKDSETMDELNPYYYNFTAPSVTGTYNYDVDVTSGANTGSNSGTFAVTGGGGDDGGGDGPGGGGGDGSSGSSAFADFSIIGWSFDDEVKIGTPTKVYVTIENTGNLKRSVVLKLAITQLTEIEYLTLETISEMNAGEIRKVALEEIWAPKLGGEHLIAITLSPVGKQTKYDEISAVFDLEGKLRYDVRIECLKKRVEQGEEAEAEITLLNLGSYFKDVDVTVWVEDATGEIIGETSRALAIYPKETRIVTEKIYVPENALSGIYHFKTNVRYGKQVAESFCSFFVEQEGEFYKNVIPDLEKMVIKIENLINSKKSRGFVVGEIEETLAEIKSELALIELRVKLKNFEGLDEEILDLADFIEKTYREISALKVTVLEISLGGILVLGGLILAIIMALIILQRRVRRGFNRFFMLDEDGIGKVRKKRKRGKKKSRLKKAKKRVKKHVKKVRKHVKKVKKRVKKAGKRKKTRKKAGKKRVGERRKNTNLRRERHVKIQEMPKESEEKP